MTVIIGIDPHKRSHPAVALDERGVTRFRMLSRVLLLDGVTGPDLGSPSRAQRHAGDTSAQDPSQRVE